MLEDYSGLRQAFRVKKAFESVVITTSIRQLRIFQIFYNKAACTFVILWKKYQISHVSAQGLRK